MTLLILGVEGSGHHMFHTFQKAINHASTGILSKFNSFPQYQNHHIDSDKQVIFPDCKNLLGSNTFYSIRTKLSKTLQSTIRRFNNGATFKKELYYHNLAYQVMCDCIHTIPRKKYHKK